MVDALFHGPHGVQMSSFPYVQAGQGLSHWCWEGPEVTHLEWWSRGPCETLRMWPGLRAPPPHPRPDSCPAQPLLVPEGLETAGAVCRQPACLWTPSPHTAPAPPSAALQMTILQGHPAVSVPLCSKVKPSYGKAAHSPSHQDLLPPPGPWKATELGTAPPRPGQIVPL